MKHTVASLADRIDLLEAHIERLEAKLADQQVDRDFAQSTPAHVSDWATRVAAAKAEAQRTGKTVRV